MYFFRIHFGLVQVDFNDPKRSRTPKASYAFYKNVVSTRQLWQLILFAETLISNNGIVKKFYSIFLFKVQKKIVQEKSLFIDYKLR